MADWLLYWRTVRHLRPAQAWFYLLRRGLPARRVSAPATAKARTLTLQAPITVSGIHQGEGRFCFLNQTVKLDDKNGVDWCPDQVPRLWRYNLHYFDFLREPERPLANKARLLQQWVQGNPQNTQPGWEPFTTSLRIVNWVIFFCEYPEQATPDLQRSLFTQAAWLEKNDERHILANHYFENLKALVFAGAYFNGKAARRWLRKGTRGVLEQLSEQTLEDGGHYERTPQYHGLMLENTLDLHNLAHNNPALFSGELFGKFAQQLHAHNEKATTFFEDIQFPDGRPPLFRDTAFGISPSAEQLRKYLTRLTDASEASRAHLPSLIRKSASGLYGYRNQGDMLLITAGAIGPGYQPGHTHCDLLSYELMLAGQRIIVDSGVSEYEPGAMRHYARSTAAHNTVAVDSEEQSEIWGEFRVGRRAEVLEANIEQSEQSVKFTGKYRGFPTVRGGIIHRRDIQVTLANNGAINTLTVTDHLGGDGVHEACSYIHLHPDVTVLASSDSEILLEDRNETRMSLKFSEPVAFTVNKSFYCAEFGMVIHNPCIQLRQTSVLPITLEYTISAEC